MAARARCTGPRSVQRASSKLLPAVPRSVLIGAHKLAGAASAAANHTASSPTAGPTERTPSAARDNWLLTTLHAPHAKAWRRDDSRSACLSAAPQTTVRTARCGQSPGLQHQPRRASGCAAQCTAAAAWPARRHGQRSCKAQPEEPTLACHDHSPITPPARATGPISAPARATTAESHRAGSPLAGSSQNTDTGSFAVACVAARRRRDFWVEPPSHC